MQNFKNIDWKKNIHFSLKFGAMFLWQRLYVGAVFSPEISWPLYPTPLPKPGPSS